MAHYGLLHDYRFDEEGTGDDIRGANVYGRSEEKLGEIDDVIFEHSTAVVRYLVVDTGGWFSHKKFLVPAHRLHTAAEHKDHFSVNLDKSQIQTLPGYNEADLESEQKWKRCAKKHDDAWHAGPVENPGGADRDLTPASHEMPEVRNSLASLVSRQEQEDLESSVIPAGADEVTTPASAIGIGPRWRNFESRLRQHRCHIIESCPACTLGPALRRR
jgi:hypothetical protein